ncbi:MAG: ThiF family adenylyltransferase [Actinomycetota bacterium]|nr:ThiF family adenylyltransferase [Actinomycetota bacterium]
MTQGAGKRVEVVPAGDDRYDRQTLITWWDQARLREATVLVVGAGALGNEIVKNLALMGVGRILVCDLDRVENSNLARCVFFRAGDEGAPKAEVLAQRAEELNPDVQVVPFCGDVRLTIGLGVFAAVDVVFGGLDSREARLFVNQACWKTTTPFLDGAIEGLMGSARVFLPPDSACYECTMSERDHELVAARRTCALLTREEMLAGKVPTTATTASLVAAVQVQEAVKLLHGDRLGEPALAGAGYQFVGLTHDSYVVRFSRREDCLSHDTYDLAGAAAVDPWTTYGELLEHARSELGPDAVVELEHELVLGATCSVCGHAETIRRAVVALDAGSGVCPGCGNLWQLELAHSVDGDSPLLESTHADLGLPAADVVVGRSGFERRFYLLTGGEPAVEVATAALAGGVA